MKSLLLTRPSSSVPGRKIILLALPWQQRGTAPALPISGLSSAVWTANPSIASPGVDGTGVIMMQSNSSGYNPGNATTKTLLDKLLVNLSGINANTVDLSEATTFNVADLRLAFQIQKWMERNARAGVRYTEFLGAHFGVKPRDDRLQRPEYLGGSKNPVIISEVLQTSSTDTESPQGNLAGHGITVGQTFCASYFAQEFGLIMGIMSVMPKPAYQQGSRPAVADRPGMISIFPSSLISEQAIERVELYAWA